MTPADLIDWAFCLTLTYALALGCIGATALAWHIWENRKK